MLRRKNHKYLLRGTALFLVLTLSSHPHAEAALPSQLPHKNILSPETGSVEDVFKGTSGKTIYYIQDAHDSLDAQINIAAIIQTLVQKEGVSLVLEEGFEGRVPTDDYFRLIKPPELKKKVSYLLLDQLLIGGAEYAHINRTRDFVLEGAEDLALYKRNINAYKEAAVFKEAVKRELQVVESAVLELIRSRVPAQVFDWIRTKRSYEREEIGLERYFAHMNRLLPLTTGMRESFPELSAVLSEGEKEEAGEEPEISASRLLEELSGWESAFLEKSLIQKEGRALLETLLDIDRIQKLSEMRLSSSEFEGVKEALRSLKTEEIISRGNSRKNRILSKGWEIWVRKAERFYEIAGKRDRALGGKLDQFLAGKEKTAVLVFGGFHKDAIRKMLREKNISYILLSPRINGIDSRHQEYYHRLMTSASGFFSFPVSPAKAARPPHLFLRPVGEASAYVEALGKTLAADTENLRGTAPRVELRNDESPGGFPNANAADEESQNAGTGIGGKFATILTGAGLMMPAFITASFLILGSREIRLDFHADLKRKETVETDTLLDSNDSRSELRASGPSRPVEERFYEDYQSFVRKKTGAEPPELKLDGGHRYRWVYNAAAAIFGVDEANDKARNKRAGELLEKLYALPESRRAYLLEAAFDKFDVSAYAASGEHRFYPLALALANYFSGKNIFSFENISALISFNPRLVYLKKDYLLYKAGQAGQLPYLELPRPPAKKKFRWLDIGSAPKEHGAPTLNFIRNFFNEYLGYELDVTGTDIFFPVLRETDGEIAFHNGYTFDKEGRAAFEGIEYRQASVPAADITSDAFHLGKFDFASITMTLHHLAGDGEPYDPKPMTSKRLFYQQNPGGKEVYREKYVITPAQQKAVDNLLGSLETGGILFLNFTYGHAPKIRRDSKANEEFDIKRKNEMQREAIIEKSNSDLFLIIQRTGKNEWTLYDRAIPFRPDLSPYNSKKFIFGRFKPIINAPHISDVFPQLKKNRKAMRKAAALVEEADVLAYAWQRPNQSAWGYVFQAAEVKRDGGSFVDIFEAYLRHVSAEKKSALLGKVRAYADEQGLVRRSELRPGPAKASARESLSGGFLETTAKLGELMKTPASVLISYEDFFGRFSQEQQNEVLILAKENPESLFFITHADILDPRFGKLQKLKNDLFLPNFRIIPKGYEKRAGPPSKTDMPRLQLIGPGAEASRLRERWDNAAIIKYTSEGSGALGLALLSAGDLGKGGRTAGGLIYHEEARFWTVRETSLEEKLKNYYKTRYAVLRAA